MKITRVYINEIKTKIIISDVINSVKIVSEREYADSGYFRARMMLVNGDFFEVSEYFVVELGKCLTKEYSYQWMDGLRKKLIKRWDNSKHFPELTNFPNHIHLGSDCQVIAGTVLNVIEMIDLIASELKSDDKGF